MAECPIPRRAPTHRDAVARSAAIGFYQGETQSNVTSSICSGDAAKASPTPRSRAVNRPAWKRGVTASHNPALRKLIDTGHFSVEVAGPYGDLKTAAAVEAALHLGLVDLRRPTARQYRARGRAQFAPLGVPIELADRLVLEPLSLPELGRLTGGILLVRLASGGAFKNDELRRKFDPSNLDDEVVAENVARWWWVEPLVKQWEAGGEWPKVVAGLAGPPKRRYVAGALEVDPIGEWTAPLGSGYEFLSAPTWASTPTSCAVASSLGRCSTRSSRGCSSGSTAPGMSAISLPGSINAPRWLKALTASARNGRRFDGSSAGRRRRSSWLTAHRSSRQPHTGSCSMPGTPMTALTS